MNFLDLFVLLMQVLGYIALALIKLLLALFT